MAWLAAARGGVGSARWLTHPGRTAWEVAPAKQGWVLPRGEGSQGGKGWDSPILSCPGPGGAARSEVHCMRPGLACPWH